MSSIDEPEKTDYIDDVTIKDEVLLYRRVKNQPYPPAKQIIWDNNKNCWRPSSAAFSNHPDGSPMSVSLGDTLAEQGLTPITVLEGHDEFLLVSFSAKVARISKQGVIRKPLQDEIAHGEVFGKKTRGIRRALAAASEWYGKPNLPKPG